jgi:7,8-dihydropterin-6-yl-methyl-4-(beta-D-ribofuranosyl)aminobenzene 5'-phosphate synthase
LTCEHGLSLYIETGDLRILFDAGQTGAFADNARHLGVDLGSVDFAVLSHGHYDHGGGLMRFLQENDSAPVYISCHADRSCYHGPEKYIGLAEDLLKHPRLIRTEGETEIAPGILLCSAENLAPVYPVESFGLQVLDRETLVADDFRHEQYLLIREGEKLVCISGCSHKGILNITHWFRPDVLVGGFHFMKLDPAGDGRKRLDHAAKVLLASDTVYYTGHCTGESQYAYLKEKMGRRLEKLSTGLVVEF